MSRIVITTQAQAHETRRVEGVFFLCDRCRQIKPVKTDCGTGYGYAPGSDRPVCYVCCGQTERLRMLATGRATLYLTDKGIVNWPGTLCFTVGDRRTFRHPFSHHAVVVYFRGPDGKLWSGKNIGDSQIAHCRRLKGV